MNIDLLFTPKNEAGLICSSNLVTKAVAALFDLETGILSLELSDMDSLELNIPVEEEFRERLDHCPQVHVGAVKEGKIAQAYQVPLMLLDDPYRAQAFSRVKPPKKPLAAFQYFLKSCTFGQPVHRDDAGDESTMGCILGDVVPAAVEFAPHLARRLSMEVAPTAAPTFAPGLGMGGSSGGGGTYRRTHTARHITPYEESDDQE
ncbi:MAG: hypothetical protein KDI13_05820 [Alphaproteobacteria bacterium]|nr:hypothetical protein [Alphaproteobacteria bacterium]